MYPVQNASIPRASQLIEGIEIKSPLKLQPQMTRRSRQPVAPLRVAVAERGRDQSWEEEASRGWDGSWDCTGAAAITSSAASAVRESARKNCMLQCGRQRWQSAGRGKRQSCQLLLQRCSCSKMACHGLLTSPLAACCCSLLVQHFPISHCDCSAGGRGRRRIAYCNFSHDYVALTLAYATSSAMQCSTEWKL